jgi:hypothetical protein
VEGEGVPFRNGVDQQFLAGLIYLLPGGGLIRRFYLELDVLTDAHAGDLGEL